MATLQVRLFGRFSLARDGEALSTLGPHKVQEVLAYLLLFRGRPHARETLAGVLWGDTTTAQSKKHLRQALWQLQGALRAGTPSSRRAVLLVSPDWVQVNPAAYLWIDVVQLEEADVAFRGARTEDLDAAAAQMMERAVDLYGGELLEGWYADWCTYDRERLRDVYLRMLEQLASYCETHDDVAKGVAFGTRVLRHDRARENAHQQLMRLFYRSGDRAAALRQYGRCRDALRDELQVDPSASTLALYEQIREGRAEEPAAGAPLLAPPAGARARLPEILGHLKQLGRVLADLQEQIRENTLMVEGALKPVRGPGRSR